jgi:hypothetical protein
MLFLALLLILPVVIAMKFFQKIRPSSRLVNCQHKNVEYAANGDITRCLFCDICAGKEPGDVVFQDDKFFMFRTIAPASKHGHFLMSPKKHIRNTDELRGTEGSALIKEMVNRSSYWLLDNHIVKNPERDVRFCFHMPPWNSVDHLHLHWYRYT